MLQTFFTNRVRYVANVGVARTSASEGDFYGFFFFFAYWRFKAEKLRKFSKRSHLRLFTLYATVVSMLASTRLRFRFSPTVKICKFLVHRSWSFETATDSGVHDPQTGHALLRRRCKCRLSEGRKNGTDKSLWDNAGPGYGFLEMRHRS
ncbi:hypothetical protein Tcan_09750 [Toxocara canis]|uniref:Uncharacterized protein n=1 Tax=Toxocara canis TaxID=6265 RepID=A0A0B2VG59_TOXCA|nr:hypothetical protein Tcan_09750 [Toxocara canis]